MKRKRAEQTAEATDPLADSHSQAAVATREPGDEPVYPPAPNPFGNAHDNQAGVEMSNYSNKENRIYEVWLKFRDGKPSEAVRTLMKQNGFKWRSDVPKGGQFDVAGAWTLDIPTPVKLSSGSFPGAIRG